jgi:protocatechuate 3,4-dioxygenase beta subunit
MRHIDHDDDDRHDRGLVYDLATLRGRRTEPVLVERRGALRLMAVGGLGLVLVACGKSSPSSSSPSSPGSSVAGATTTSGATSGGGGAVTEAVPEETGGPFPGDGSNGPNVLTESGIVRRDIRSSFGSSSGTAQGVPLGLDLTIVQAGSGSPMAGAAVYVWHCDREGRYSLYSQGATDQNYLRGVQAAGSDGKVSFTSIYPAAYSGRWPHIHFEVYRDLATATSAGSKLVTSQIALLEDVSSAVYATDGYSASVQNLARTSLATDMVFSDGVSLQTPTMSGSVGSDLRLALTIAV